MAHTKKARIQKGMSHTKKATFTSSWSDLPKDIICNIGRRLDSAVDRSRLRSVCKTWHTSRNPNILSPFLPWTFSNANLPFNNHPNQRVTLIARAVFLVKPLQSSPSSTGWFLTVEERVPGKLRILYPLSTNRVKLPSNFPKYLDLSKFRVSQVAQYYCFKMHYTVVLGVQKVVFCSGSTATAMVLYGKGTLIGVRLKKGDWGYVRNSLTCSIKDVISFKGMIYAVDCYLNVLVIDYKTMNVTHTLNCGLSSRSGCTMHLVEWDKQLHLVKWRYILSKGSFEFSTQRMDEIMLKWDPENCLNSCNIFLCLGWCFLAEIPGISGDYIVCSRTCYNNSANHSTGKRQLFQDASTDLGLDVCFRRTSHGSTDSRWRNIADWLWPPPLWLLPEQYTSSSTSRDHENDKESNIDNPAMSFGANVLPPSTAVTAVRNGIAMDKQAFGATKNAHALTNQNLNQNHPTVIYNGVNVKSNLVPTLEKVWAKYGNILEGCKIRNAEMLSGALESLAKALLILQTNSGCSLDKIQADYLNSVLCDLQLMNFRIEWLVPFVEKALAVQKNKPLIDSLKDFDRAKAQAEEMKLKVLDELAKLGEVEEDLALVSEKLNVLKSMDFEQSLGEGLY